MLVVHPNSTCDVCLEGYTNGTNVPHSISCGHVFCLRCLQSLNRLMCPLCRTSFDPMEIRKLHTDRASPSTDGIEAVANLPVADPEVSTEVRHLQDKIDHIVLEGAPLTEVKSTIDEVHAWLRTQPKEEHRDLRASHRLLYRVTEDRTIIASMQQKEEEMKTRLVDADRVVEELAQKRKDEAAIALAVERSLREHYNRMNTEWNTKYEVALAECRKLYNELERLRSESLHGVVRDDSAIFPSFDTAASAAEVYGTVSEHMNATIDKLTANLTAQEDMFKLSPLPSTLHVPAELPSDDEDDGSLKKTSGLSEAYTRQSIPAISIKSSNDAMLSGSLLSRRIHEHDITMASSSLPRNEFGGIHSLMAKRQSSPPRTSSSMQYVPYDTNGDVIMASASLPRHSVLREQRQSSSSDLHGLGFGGEEGTVDLRRKQLYDILQAPTHIARETDDHFSPLSRVNSRTRRPSPPRITSEIATTSRIRTEQHFVPVHHTPNRERSASVESGQYPNFNFYVSQPQTPPARSSDNGPAGLSSPVSTVSVSPTSPGPVAQIPRPSLISRASSAAREAETRARVAASERHRRESGGSTTSLSSIASSGSGRATSTIHEQPGETLSRRGSLANHNHKGRGHAPGVQTLS